MKVKLIAIAKDEAAYLPEWIHHHLRAGFDSIAVLANGITDNTNQVLNKISEKYPVENIDADYIKAFSDVGFQRIAYGIEFKKACEDGYTHVMFLDIDEFWVTKSFGNNIKDYLCSMGDPGLIAFPWAFKTGDAFFENCFGEKNTFILDGHVKVIFKTCLNIERIEPHNVVTSDEDCLFSAGGLFCKKGENKTTISFDKTTFPESFVVHRLTRSEKEYVSLLGRGRPSTNASMLDLKDNRGGFLPRKSHHLDWNINQQHIVTYNKSYKHFIFECDLEIEIEKAREFIIERYFEVLDTLRFSKSLTKDKVDKLFKNVCLPDVIDAYKSNVNIGNAGQIPILKESVIKDLKIVVGIDNEFVDLLRDFSLSLELTALNQAIKFMGLAHLLRPRGPVIHSKLLAMKKELSQDSNDLD